jgi:hypothetical protein
MGRTLRRDLQRDDMDDFCLKCPSDEGNGGTSGLPDSSAQGGFWNESSLAVFSVATVGVRDTGAKLVDLTASFP